MVERSTPSSVAAQLAEKPIEVQAALAAHGFFVRLLEIKIDKDCAHTGITLASYVLKLSGLVAGLRRLQTALKQAERSGFTVIGDLKNADEETIAIDESLDVTIQANEQILNVALKQLTGFVQGHDPEAPGYNPTCTPEARAAYEAEKRKQLPPELKRFLH